MLFVRWKIKKLYQIFQIDSNFGTKWRNERDEENF